MAERTKTGIGELDAMLRGGFLEGDAVMVAGSSGTGKTTLALQYIVNGIADYGENGIYVTFEQLPQQLYRDALNFGWDLRKMERQDKLRLVCTSPDLLLESGREHLLDPFIKEVHARRIVIDSLSHISMYVDETEIRKEMYRLIMYLKTRNLSSLLIWESPQLVGQLSSISESGTSFLVDAIVLLKPVEIDSSMHKAMTILKARRTDHDKSLREYEITSEGVKVGTAFKEVEGIMTGSARKLSLTQEAVERFSDAFAGRPKKR